MGEIIKYLSTLNKDVLLYIIYELMKDDKISYHDITTLHIENMERLRKGETEAYFRLQARVMTMWCDTKKNLQKNLKETIKLLMDEGRVNITEEKFNKYKAK